MKPVCSAKPVPYKSVEYTQQFLNHLRACWFIPPPQQLNPPILLELGQRKHTKFYISCRLYWNSTCIQSSRIFFKHNFLTHFLVYTNLRVWVFKCKLQIRVGGWGPDSYSETSQVSSSCLDASYEHARACSTQSPKRILPLSYFILQPERGYK